MVEVVAGFEFSRAGGGGVEDTVGGIEHPDGQKHRGKACGRYMEGNGSGDEPCPQGGDGWCIEREQMPAGQRGVSGLGVIV
jgi:hypothetical protein